MYTTQSSTLEGDWPKHVLITPVKQFYEKKFTFGGVMSAFVFPLVAIAHFDPHWQYMTSVLIRTDHSYLPMS